MIMQIINWLNTNQGAVVAIATIALACITAYYAHLIRRQLKAADTPEIAIYLQYQFSLGYVLYIKNVGTGIAHDLQFKTDLSFSNRSPEFLNGINYLEHGRRIKYHLRLYLKDQKELGTFTITVDYKDSSQGKYKRSFPLYPAELPPAISTNKFQKIESSLDQIERAIKDIPKC